MSIGMMFLIEMRFLLELRKKRVTMRDFFAFRLMIRDDEESTILHSERLLQIVYCLRIYYVRISKDFVGQNTPDRA